MSKTVDREILNMVPHVDQYFGAWAMEPERFEQARQCAMDNDLFGHIAAIEASGGYRRDEPQIAVAAERVIAANGSGSYLMTSDGVALVYITGPIMKYDSSLLDGASTIRTRAAIRDAAKNDAVKGIVLVIDSPGGTVAGVDELAEDVRKAGEQKNVVAYIEDLGASAAYWVASQAKTIYANRMANVGSIGVYTVLADSSMAHAASGIKVHVVKTGKFKGTGIKGTEIDAEQLAYVQSRVDSINDKFIEAVSQGRRMQADAVRDVADGRVYDAAKAKELRLIDDIKTFDEVLAVFGGGKNNRRTKAMSDQETHAVAETEVEQATEPKQAQAATVDELEAALVGADPAFVLAQLKAGATLEDAKGAWIAEQAARLEDAQKRVERATHSHGVEALEHAAKGGVVEGAGSAAEQWNAEVKRNIEGGLDRAKAVAKVAKENPELHAAFIAEVNNR